MENSQQLSREQRDEFRRKVKNEWSLMWRERFDDHVRAEGVSANDYPLVFVDRGHVIFANRDTKTPNFSEIMHFWASQGRVYSPDRSQGGWGRFIRMVLKNKGHSRTRGYVEDRFGETKKRQQLKKGGRGWLHK